jgi:hypothetical protein
LTEIFGDVKHYSNAILPLSTEKQNSTAVLYWILKPGAEHPVLAAMNLRFLKFQNDIRNP